MPHEWAQRAARGYRSGPSRANDLIIVPDPPNYVGGLASTSHSGPYGFLQEVPFVFYGPGFVRSRGSIELDREVTLADVAPTYAQMMDYDFPRRKGRPITELMAPTEDTPNLIMTVVIDGGGWNDLRRWPGAWPFLKELTRIGTSVENGILGSSPSVTPSTHTNLSTGAFPRQHGVTGIVVRKNDGSFVGGFVRSIDYAGARTNPSVTLRMTTLADLWDRDNGNAPLVGTVSFGNYTVGMIGHGSDIEGGDKDIAAFEERGVWATDPRYFTMPSYLNDDLPGPERYLRQTDLLDGQADDKWRGHEIFPLDATPAYAPFTNDAISALIEREGFGDDELTDLFYVNYKSPDMAGHQWNMINPEQKDVLESVDAAIEDLVGFLDEQVGTDEYVLMVTADHGQTPLGVGGWGIDRDEIIADVDDVFKKTKGNEDIVERTSPTVMFMDNKEMHDNDLTAEEISSYLSNYTIGDNVGARDKETLPDEFKESGNERAFTAVYPGSAIDDVLRCTRGAR